MSGSYALQLKISLINTKPPIWRRVIVPESMTLAELHWVIQIAMGWENAHLHEFEVGGERYSKLDEFDEDIDTGARDSTAVTLRGLKLNRKGRVFGYTYDFGDNWRHRIVVEELCPAGHQPSLPVCVAGKRACPPEDSGGPGGYVIHLAVASDPDHPYFNDDAGWLDPEFDPEAFEMEPVNRSLNRGFRSR
jgi:hypothetical protein